MVGDDDEDHDDHEHAGHVPPGRDVVDLRQEARAERVDQPVQGDDHGVGQEHVALAERVAEPQVHQRRDERRRAEVDGRGDGDLADEVEPAREPAPAGAAEPRRPVVEAARGRVGRGDLAHRERDEDAEAADDEPAPGDGHRAAPADRDVVRRETAGEDGDDGERDGEVREPAPSAQELLGIAEPVQRLLVLGQLVRRRRWEALLHRLPDRRSFALLSGSVVCATLDRGPVGVKGALGRAGRAQAALRARVAAISAKRSAMPRPMASWAAPGCRSSSAM